MRPQQQNRRMRGRNNNNNNNNNRKGPNPLTRNYESNGPDVKIRGSAQQIAEKYATLARDAISAGDRVLAENYLQHAEHYNRIIAAAQAQMPIQNFQANRDDFDDDLDDERDDQPQAENAGSQQGEGAQPAYANGSGPQPAIEGTPAEVALNPEASGNSGQPQRAERQNGYNGNGHGEENFRRNRRSRRGRGGRPDFGENAETEQGEDGAETGLPEQLMQPVVRRSAPAEGAAPEASAAEPAAAEGRSEPAPAEQE